MGNCQMAVQTVVTDIQARVRARRSGTLGDQAVDRPRADGLVERFTVGRRVVCDHPAEPAIERAEIGTVARHSRLARQRELNGLVVLPCGAVRVRAEGSSDVAGRERFRVRHRSRIATAP